MKTRRLGKNGPIVSALGLGCMGMSDFYGSRRSRDDGESLSTIEAALEAGVTFLDTGDFYGMGHNETLVGRAIRGKRDRAFLSVKFGLLRSPSGAVLGLDGRPAAVKTFAAYSLQRLGVDVIDLYQPGRIDPAVPIEDTVGAVDDLIREGKVRCLGLSEVNADQIRRAQAVHPVTAIQVEYSLATRMIEPTILPTARGLGIGVVAYGVVSRGLLTGTTADTFPPEDFRAHLPRFQGENRVKNLEKVQVLKSLAAAKNVTAAQLAIAWVLAKGDDIVPLIGTTKRSRLSENLKALDLSLSQKEIAHLDDVFKEGAIQGDRYPTAHMALVAK